MLELFELDFSVKLNFVDGIGVHVRNC